MTSFPQCDPDCAERAACTETGFGHSMCGTCAEHHQPAHHCPPECWLADEKEAGR